MVVQWIDSLCCTNNEKDNAVLRISLFSSYKTHKRQCVFCASASEFQETLKSQCVSAFSAFSAFWEFGRPPLRWAKDGMNGGGGEWASSQKAEKAWSFSVS